MDELMYNYRAHTLTLCTMIYVFTLCLANCQLADSDSTSGAGFSQTNVASIPFRLDVAPSQPSFVNGERIVLHVRITNTSDTSQTSPIPDLGKTDLDDMLKFFQVSITDSSGSSVRLTRYETVLQRPVWATTAIISRAGKKIPPGGTQEVDFDISSVFDLSLATQYKASISCVNYQPIFSQDGRSVLRANTYVLGPSNINFSVTEPTSDYYRAASIVRQLSTQLNPRVKYIYALQSQDALRKGSLAPTNAGLVSMYQVDDAGAVSTTLYPGVSCGLNPQSIAFSHSGANAYVAAQDGTIWQYSVDSSGVLSPLSATSVKVGASISSIIVSRNDRQVYVTDPVDGYICSLDRNSDGLLMPGTKRKTSLQGSSVLLAEPATDHFLYCLVSNDIAQFTIESDGSLVRMSPPWVYSGKGASGIVVSHNGKYLYVANSQDSTISQFGIGSDGALTQLVSAVACTDPFPSFLELNKEDSRLYETSYLPGAVTEFDVEPSGSLVERVGLGPVNCLAGGSHIDPDEKFVFVMSLTGPTFITAPLPLSPNNPLLEGTLPIPFGYGMISSLLRSIPVSFDWYHVPNGPTLTLYLQKQQYFPKEPIILSLLSEQLGTSTPNIGPVAINVLDAEGKQVPRTAYGLQQFGENGPIRPSFEAYCANYSSNSEYFVLNRFFDMTIPEIYHVEVSVGKTFDQKKDVCVALPTSQESWTNVITYLKPEE